MMHGKTTRALLANWSLCCIRINANLDALSASFASLRIRHEAKAVTRLAKSLLCVGCIVWGDQREWCDERMKWTSRKCEILIQAYRSMRERRLFWRMSYATYVDWPHWSILSWDEEGTRSQGEEEHNSWTSFAYWTSSDNVRYRQ